MNIPDGLLATPFHIGYPPDLEVECIDVMGYAVPLWITDPANEYDAFRNRVGLLEYSMLYRWNITGPGAARTANAVFSRDVTAMTPGAIAYGVVVREDGTMVDDPTVAYYNSEHVLLVGGSPEVGEILNAHRVDGAVVTEQRGDHCVLSVQGPRSRELLQSLTDTDLSNDAFPYYTFLTEVRIAGIPCQINRIGFTAELGYEVVAPRASAEALLHAVQKAGLPLGSALCGAAALMMCRIEAGMVMAHLEYDDSSTPFECRLGWAVDLAKAPFVGRDALALAKERPSSRVVTLRIDGDPDGLDGAGILRDGDESGAVTMAVPSPHLGGATIAMARVAQSAAAVGTALTVDAPGGPRAAEVLATPVYDPERTRVRS